MRRGGGLKGSPGEADGAVMDSEIQAAWRRAGLKLAIGSLVIAAAIGIRIVLVTPADPTGASAGEGPASAGLLSDTEATTRPGEIRTEVAGGPEIPGEQERSLGSRIGALGKSFQDGLTGAEPKSRDGDRIVACRLRGVSQYMRADDCDLRGGSVLEGAH